MSRLILPTVRPCCIGLFLVLLVSARAVPTASPSQQHQTILSILNESWTPLTSEEQLRLAIFLKQKTDAYLEQIETAVPPDPEDDPEVDEKQAKFLKVKITNLKASLKEIGETLKLIERSIQEVPAEYAQTGPLLWLTVAKVISTEKENANELVKLGFAESSWPGAFDLALPRVFIRILEPQISEILRALRKEHLIFQSR